MKRSKEYVWLFSLSHSLFVIVFDVYVISTFVKFHWIFVINGLKKGSVQCVLYISFMYNNKPLALSFLCLSCIFNALRVVLRWCAVFQLCPCLCVSKREKSTFSRFIHVPDSLNRTKRSDKYKNEQQQQQRMTWPSTILIYILHNPTKWKNLQMKKCSAKLFLRFWIA